MEHNTQNNHKCVVPLNPDGTIDWNTIERERDEWLREMYFKNRSYKSMRYKNNS